ncbi:hypothetical protein AVEN_165732-1 [Araneus ventricosus]|uniref:Uncharacterized protein n=1 Tax=Araneus ventricosus TaxID=182803 RepID=A0A4Y2C3C7_ARAVE|nr:hypothetical protein AVEN_165732-1 [Araneus ventricosus]
MPPTRLLQQYVFPMTTTGDNILQASHKSSNSEFSRQWSLIPGSRKTTSPTKLSPSHSASMFTCCGCGRDKKIYGVASLAALVLVSERDGSELKINVPFGPENASGMDQ